MSDEFDFEAESVAFKKQYKAGDGAALLHMIVLAWVYRQVVPEWAGAELVRLIQRGADGAFDTWDMAFGSPWQFGKRKEALRLSQARLVWTVGQKLIAKDTKKREKQLLAGGTKKQGKPLPRDNEFFEAVAKRTHVGGRSKVTTLYGEFAEIVRRLNAELKLPD